MPPKFKLFAPPLLLAALAAYGLHHIWYRAFGMWAAGVRPLFVPAASMAQLSYLRLGLCFGLEFAVATLVFAAAFLCFGKRLARALPFLLGIAILASQIAFAVFAWNDITSGIPWSSDHPSFLFRLNEVRATFPALGGWNPWWNAGTVHFISATSGTHGYAALTAPFLAAMEPHEFHAPVLFFWIWIGFPWLAAACVRATGARPVSALAAAAMMECYCRSQFIFGWHYGILGGLVTAGLSVPLGALCYKLAVQRRGGWPVAIATAVVAWLSCIWTLGYATCAGLVAGAIANSGRWTRRSATRMIAAAALALALLAPWIWTSLGPASGIVGFASVQRQALPWLQTFRHGLMLLLYRLLEWHPAILAFGVFGLAVSGPRGLRRLAMPPLLLIFAVLVYSKWNVRSQCYRVIFQGAAFAVFPAAVLAGRLLGRTPPARRGSPASVALAAAKGATLAALVLGLRISGVHAMNCGAGLPYYTSDSRLDRFIGWIRDSVPENGRLAFAGETANSVGGGTVAYLPILTKREMMADDYYSFPPGLTKRNYPPAPYRKSIDAFLEFSRIYGITHWAVVERNPRKLGFYRATPGCGGRPGAFDEVAEFPLRGGTVRVFSVCGAGTPSPFYIGDGTVSARENLIVATPGEGYADGLLVLRYNWRDGLFCRTPGASIEPYPADENITLTAIRPNGAKSVEIGYRPAFRPLAPNFDGTFQH